MHAKMYPCADDLSSCGSKVWSQAQDCNNILIFRLVNLRCKKVEKFHESMLMDEFG